MDPLAPDFANTPVSARRPRFDYLPAGDVASPAVSVITPFHNPGPVFEETAQALLRQSLQQWEWIIVSDHSNDTESAQLLTSYRDRDPRIRVIVLDRNQGPAAARNAGIARAQADLLFFLDADDLIEPTALEKTAWCLDSYPGYGFCKGRTVSFGAQEVANPVGFEYGQMFLSRNPVTLLSMVRREVVEAVGGFDESLTQGLEDWEFWLHCADEGYWGTTIPEYLDWYRRRTDHSDRWSAWTKAGVKETRKELRRRYPRLYSQGIPQTEPRILQPYGDIRDDAPFANGLAKTKKRILLILPWMAMGGADKFNLDLMVLLRERGYEISVATTLPGNYAWYQRFAEVTPDIFILPHFLQVDDYGRFLDYVIKSRQMDTVLLSNSQTGYRFLPFLRSRNPETTFVDYNHMEEDYWNNGGHPRTAVGYQQALDLNIVSSKHLKEWMMDRGADPERIEVCYTNIDTAKYAPSAEIRARVRQELGIGPDTAILLYAGRLCEQKQPKVFAPVMRALRVRKLDYVCLVAGEGEDKGWLSRYIWRHRLGKQVRMLGRVGLERMQELMVASDIFFLPSQMEGISLTIFEAMAQGVVTVGADVGGQIELLTPECGTLIQRGTREHEVATYTQVLDDLIRTPERRKAMGKASRERIQAHFELEQMGDRMAYLLEQAERWHEEQPRAAFSTGLGTAHAVQAVEYERVLRASNQLTKYWAIEVPRWRFNHWWRERLNALNYALMGISGPFRRVKDWAWIRAHKIKVRLLKIEESS